MTAPEEREKKKWIQVAWQLTAILAAAASMGLTVNGLRSEGRLPLVADWSVKAQLETVAAETGENMIVSLEEAQVLFFAGKAVFIDARPGSIYRQGHIQGAVSLPWEDYEARFEEVMVHIPQDLELITYCDGDACSLSKELAMSLLARGYGRVRVLLNGWTAWVDASLPVEG